MTPRSKFKHNQLRNSLKNKQILINKQAHLFNKPLRVINKLRILLLVIKKVRKQKIVQIENLKLQRMKTNEDSYPGPQMLKDS